MKRITSLLLALVMLLALSACGSSESKSDGGKKTNATSVDGFLFEGKENPVDLGKPEKELDPEDVYKNLTYTNKMFYGDYRLLGGKEAEEKFAKNSDHFTFKKGSEESELTTLPFRIEAGPHTLNHRVYSVEGYDWVRLNFMKKTESGNYLYTALCSYKVEGNKLICKPLETFNVDDATKKIDYSFSDTVLEYEFSFKGRNLTLTKDSKSITITTCLDVSDDSNYFCVDAYLSPESKAVANIDSIDILYNEDEPKYDRFYLETAAGEDSYSSTALLKENGLFTLTSVFEEETKTRQFVYFYCRNDGLILTDGENTYYYNANYSDRNSATLNTFVSEDQTGKIGALSDAEIKAIVEKKENLIDDLAKAFEAEGIKVTVNQKSGELAMDSSVLFGGDSSVLTDDGKKFLDKFVKAYTSIVFSAKYEGFVSKTMVEGHTAPVGNSSYEDGLPLSVERAKKVKEYCASLNSGDSAKLSAALEDIGYSNSKPILDNDGKIDMAKSRRVSFRFIINLDK